MGLSKTWYTSANRAMDDVTTAFKSNCSILFALKGFLTGALTGTGGTGGQPPSSAFWTVDSSSNGTIAGSGDKFSASFVAAEWVRAAAASAHSWFVLKSPVSAGILDGPYYLMVSQGTANDNNIIIAISRAQPTGGTTTADPTSSPAQSFYATAAYLFGVAAAGKCHVVMDAAGNFHFLSSFNGSGRFSTYVSVMELTETRSSGDFSRAMLLADGKNTTTGVPDYSGGFTVATGARGYCIDGSTAITGANGAMLSLNWTGNAGDSAVRVGVSANDSKVDAMPLAYVYDRTAAKAGGRGRFADIWYIGTQAAPGSGTPSAATPDRIVAGNTLIPFSVTPSL